MARLFLGLGSNLGPCEEMLHRAIAEVEKKIGKIIVQSAFYATKPWGYASSHDFLNACICVETAESPMQCLYLTQAIEKELGRKEKSGTTYADRVIDIDILFYDQEIIKTAELEIPHPLLHQRQFVLEPLCEIAADWMHPVLHQTIREIQERRPI